MHPHNATVLAGLLWSIVRGISQRRRTGVQILRSHWSSLHFFIFAFGDIQLVQKEREMITWFFFLVGILLSVKAGPTDHKETVPEHLRGKHTTQFDHEAFLGKSESDRFDQLTPQEARRRLSIIVDRIDTNKDGFVTEKELEAWVGHVGKRYIMDDVMKLAPLYDEDGDGLIKFEEYKQVAFGEHIDDLNAIYDTRFRLTFKDMINRKKKLFVAADLNGDNQLTKDELADFLHPEEAPHMKNMYVEIRMEDMDKNKDKYLTLSEYLEDVWPLNERDEEPEWLPREKSNFASRDTDGDGKISLEEFKTWLIPENFDLFNVEAQHLIHYADSDLDNKLTKEEILQHQDMFVGSRATEWGEYLNRHDEF